MIRVERSGRLIFGENVRIGAMPKMFCVQKIEFGNELDFSWECQVFDANFHFVRDVATGELDQRDGEIYIGNRNWIGNRVTVMKGTRTPDDFIVAANSLCNRNYLYMAPYSIAGGIPLSILRSNKSRVFESIETVPGF